MQVHHITYERFGRELFKDLIVVCDGCHELLHAFITRMSDKGFPRRKVMERLAPRCIRRLLNLHDIFRSTLNFT